MTSAVSTVNGTLTTAASTAPTISRAPRLRATRSTRSAACVVTPGSSPASLEEFIPVMVAPRGPADTSRRPWSGCSGSPGHGRWNSMVLDVLIIAVLVGGVWWWQRGPRQYRHARDGDVVSLLA